MRPSVLGLVVLGLAFREFWRRRLGRIAGCGRRIVRAAFCPWPTRSQMTMGDNLFVSACLGLGGTSLHQRLHPGLQPQVQVVPRASPGRGPRLPSSTSTDDRATTERTPCSVDAAASPRRESHLVRPSLRSSAFFPLPPVTGRNRWTDASSASVPASAPVLPKGRPWSWRTTRFVRCASCWWRCRLGWPLALGLVLGLPPWSPFWSL